jgi:phosphopantothenoylcysteine synthetase/decarboxylase
MGRDEVQFVFHAAALCDFRVAEVRDDTGETVAAEKIPSREGALQVKLEPAPKLIAELRRQFPASILVGWKYEVDGTPDSAIAAGRRQIDEFLTDACVVNGQAYGDGFGMVTRAGERVHLPNKPALCRYLIEWAARVPVAAAGPRPESFHALASFMPLGPFV